MCFGCYLEPFCVSGSAVRADEASGAFTSNSPEVTSTAPASGLVGVKLTREFSVWLGNGPPLVDNLSKFHFYRVPFNTIMDQLSKH